MPASAAIRPMMLQQATRHAQAGPPRAAAQWYLAPDVGFAEHSSDMQAATARVNSVATGQPRDISRGPPISKPYPNSVTAPVRIEMMENEMAKFENPPISRINSWAYP